jgi:hypothetical protein
VSSDSYFSRLKRRRHREAGPKVDAETLARRFHETYERLAPAFGYTTRTETAVPWEQIPEVNRLLMIAVCQELLRDLPVVAEGPDCQAGK